MHKSKYCSANWHHEYGKKIRNEGTTLQQCKNKCDSDDNCKAITYAEKFRSDKDVCILCAQTTLGNSGSWTSYVKIPQKGR